ncbi:MAG: presqualene diphosphate synthase HpnD [Myxococcales bacterium]|nr:presqualene diphosphate synthase HpnD [Myxococcales bacterium]
MQSATSDRSISSRPVPAQSLVAEHSLDGRKVAAAVTAQSGSNFSFAFLFMPKHRRQAIHAVYAYCRVIDDIVDSDDPVEVKQAALAQWEDELHAAFCGGTPQHPVAIALSDAHRRFGIRYEDALLVLRGCQTDLHKRRYKTWSELYDYCYHVASAVGLMCIELFGCTHPDSRRYAVHLGQALQLTNILRDIAEDAARDRIYLPQDLLSEFGLTEADILAGKRGTASLWLVRHLAARARKEYALAKAVLPRCDRRALLPAEIMGSIYFRLLEEVERRGDDVLVPGSRCRLSAHRKIERALHTFASVLLPFGDRLLSPAY